MADALVVGNTTVVDTFAEAFGMSAARVIITAATPYWAMTSAQSMTGFATSVIGCKTEAGIERELSPDETPDGRPGVSVLLFSFDTEGVGKRLVERVGQCVLTCATTSCFNGLHGAAARKWTDVGGQLRFFGDGYQISKQLGGRRFWRVPVMDGEFVVEEMFGVTKAVGGGNLIIMGRDLTATLNATQAAVLAMRKLPDVILPFPGGMVRSGSKVGSKYKFLSASTNQAYCPTLRGFVPSTDVPDGVNCILEIVVNGLSAGAIEAAMRDGILAAAEAGAMHITAGNYGGKLGQFKFGLHELLEQKQSAVPAAESA